MKHAIIPSRPIGDGRFRARCTCGWKSEPVDVFLVYDTWAQHYLDAMKEKRV